MPPCVLRPMKNFVKSLSNKIGKRGLALIAVNAALIIAAAVCFGALSSLSRLLPSQLAAARWQGGSDTPYTQLSAFIPVDERFTLNAVASLREELSKALHEAALDVASEDILFVDAWSAKEKVGVSSALGKGDVYATAVGGEFFTFHPITLISGSYISASDLMQDRALLDEETAWLLFGGTDIQGMTFKINGVPFVVAGVIEREQDFATRLAYTDGMGIFISYDALQGLASASASAAASDSASADAASASAASDVGIECYELVMPDPVEGFALGFLREKFPIKTAELVSNSDRFSVSSLWQVVKSFTTRAMQTRGVVYPYWENAARCVEGRGALLVICAFAALILPACCALYYSVRLCIMAKRALEQRLLPRWRDELAEAIRVRQRARWERRHDKSTRAGE